MLAVLTVIPKLHLKKKQTAGFMVAFSSTVQFQDLTMSCLSSDISDTTGSTQGAGPDRDVAQPAFVSSLQEKTPLPSACSAALAYPNS
jgi:hypothetical protein